MVQERLSAGAATGPQGHRATGPSGGQFRFGITRNLVGAVFLAAFALSCAAADEAGFESWQGSEIEIGETMEAIVQTTRMSFAVPANLDHKTLVAAGSGAFLFGFAVAGVFVLMAA